MLEQLVPFLTASILLTLSPGPDIIYVLLQGMTHGKKFGLITALGLVTGILFHTSLVAFGISALISQSQLAFLVVRLFGAGYLLYLAIQVYRSDARVNMAAVEEKKNLLSLYKRGLLMNVLNPKVAIFFLAFFPGFLWKPEENVIFQFYLLGLLFMLQALLIFSGVAFLAGKIATYLRRHPYSGTVFKWLQILVFVGIAFFILT